MPFLRRISNSVLIIAVSFFAVFSANAKAQTPIWRNDWTVATQPTLQSSSPSFVTFAPDGDLLLGSASPNNLDYQFVRLTSAGTIRWAINLDGGWGVETDGTIGLQANADGSAFVSMSDASGYAGGNFIAKISPLGAVAWTRQISTFWLAVQSAQLIATANCGGVTALNSVSGQLAWQYIYSIGLNDCAGNGLTADGQGNVYATFATFSGGTNTGFHTVKMGVDGHVIWDISTNGNSTPAPVGVSGSLLYLTTPSNVRAIRTGDGSTAWTSSYSANAGLADFVLAGNPAELVVATANSVQRLAVDTGQPRWSQSASGKLNVVNGEIIVNATGSITKLDSDTGTVNWSTQLPVTDLSGKQQDFFLSGASSDGNITTVAKSSAILDTSVPPIFLQRVDFGSGQVLNQVTVDSIPQGVLGTSIEEDANHVVSVALVAGESSSSIHVRRLNTLNGSQDWESIDTTQEHSAYNTLGMTVAGDAIAVALTVNKSGNSPYFPFGTGLRVESLDRATGVRRWAISLYDVFQDSTYSSDAAADADGNIFIAYGGNALCQPPLVYPQTYCMRQTLVKLSAVDGAVLWRYVNSNVGIGNQVLPQKFALRGFDIVLAGPFTGANSSSTLIKLSGADGSVIWSSTVFAATGIYEILPVDDGNIIVKGDGFAKVDVTSGNIIWTNPYTNSNVGCTVRCYIYGSLVLPNGDILDTGEGNRVPSVYLQHSSPGGVEDHWYLGSSDPQLTSAATSAAVDTQGKVWLRMGRHFRDGIGGINFLAGFDTTTGAVSGQQTMNAYDHEALADTLGFDGLQLAPENNHLLTAATVVDSPLPTTSGNALLDTTVTANGDLSLQLTLDHSKVKAGDVVGFHFLATYSGDAPISGAHLRGYLPWAGGVSGVTCVAQKASSCVIDTRSGNIQASFDIQSGGKIAISGQVQVLAGSDTPAIEAFVYGPTGLMEQDTINNFAHTGLVESIFFSGFE